jgi:nickel transport protein
MHHEEPVIVTDIHLNLVDLGKTMQWIRLALLALLNLQLFVWAGQQQAVAHGTEYRVLDPGNAVAVEFFYSGQQPMSYAEVKVFAPEDQKIEYQSGRTDARGRFVFYPQSPGKWRILAEDGTGHQESLSLEIEEGDLAGTDQESSESQIQRQAGLPKAWGVVLGLSLILNICSGLYFWKGRKLGAR